MEKINFPINPMKKYETCATTADVVIRFCGHDFADLHGIAVAGLNDLLFSLSNRALQQEIPEAYKDIDDVVDSTGASGISQKVAKMRPLAVIKG